MEILLTNDDGIDAPGLASLARAADGLGKLRVVAPLDPQSGASHSMCDRTPLRVTGGTVPGAVSAHAVAGRPADCSRIGLCHYAPGAAWVLSGINAGGNLGVDAYYSGTVGAAREASILGRPAIAVSQYIRDAATLDWERAAHWARHVIVEIMRRPVRQGLLWNVNLPQPETDAVPSIRVVPMAVDSHVLDYHRDDQPGEVSVFHYRGRYQDRPAPAGSDVHAVFSGDISVTPVALDATDTALMGAEDFPPLTV